MRRRVCFEYLLIVICGVLYALCMHLFLFPLDLVSGGTGGLSVIINAFLPFSSSNISVVVNTSLLVAAFILLGSSMAIKTTVGSLVTTLAIGLFGAVLPTGVPLVSNVYLSSIIGSVLLAVLSGFLFYLGSSSGGTDILALIIRKYSGVNVGMALLLTDLLIVIGGGFVFDIHIAIASLIGLVIKTFGIDLVIYILKKLPKKRTNPPLRVMKES